MSLSQESLEEYRRLYVSPYPFTLGFPLSPRALALIKIYRKAQASVHAVEERQSLEILSRDEKTAARKFAQLNDKQEELERKKAKLQEELGVQGGRKGEVGYLFFMRCLLPLAPPPLLPLFASTFPRMLARLRLVFRNWRWY